MIPLPGRADLIQGLPMPQPPSNRIPELPALVVTPATINDDHDVAHVARNVILPFALVPICDHLTRRRSRAGKKKTCVVSA